MRSLLPRLIIAGLKGGAGKTTVSLGLIAAWREKGLSVVPYKKGPDYIDAGWLSCAAGRPCYNLDPFLITKEKILMSFGQHFQDSDCAVIEGNRGLYDGMDAAGTFSTAELSKTLKSPVILVMDCSKMTRTAGAIILGMQTFDKKVDIRAVILNQIAGVRHEKIIRETIGKYCGIPVLGAIPKLSRPFISERHMGLTSSLEHSGVLKAISSAADTARKYLDLEGIWCIAGNAPPLKPGSSACSVPAITKGNGPLIGVIRDSAFQFYYPENFEELERRGARLLEISALKEKRLPPIDALYIGGGFPETNAIALSKNVSFRKAVRKEVENGLPIYAECGGLMYLGRALLLGRKRYSMAGVFPLIFCLEEKPQAHGYTVVETTRANPFFKKGTVLKGHEFHYSRVIDKDRKERLRFSFLMKRGQGIINRMDGLCYKNVFATYTHLHALGAEDWADGLIKRALWYRERRLR